MCNFKTSSQARTLALAVLVFLTVCTQAQAQTWYQWSASAGGNDHWYRLTTTAHNWEGARAQTLAFGPVADLVSINSQGEQDFLAEKFGVEHLFWIGLTDKEVEGTWQWSNGDAVDYTNWLPGQPNDAGPDYTMMNFGAFRGDPNLTAWNDVALNYGGFLGIVESAVPEPSAYVLLGVALLAFWRVRRRFARV